MTQEEMLDVLENMRYAFQRFRSTVKETQEYTGSSDEVLADLFPWVFTNKCPLLAIQRCLDNEHVTGMEFYNFLYILHNFCPEVMVGHFEYDFPEPKVEMALW